MAIRRIGVLTSGGDAPGMNAVIRSVVRTAASKGIECVGIRRGYNGLINGDIIRLDSDSVSRIINKGGTMLYTARSEEFMTEIGQNKAAATCKQFGLDGIVAVGGDGTFRGLYALSKHGVSVVGIPATIDNDISCTDYCLGYDTAANTAVEAIDRLRDTMQSHDRCSVVEVMGHRAGHLALYVGLATSATAVLVPEKEFDFENDIVENIRKARLNGKTHFMIIMAEGVGKATKMGERIADELALDTRVTILGHLQRGGIPTANDRILASRLGVAAIEALKDGQRNIMVGVKNDQIVYVPFNKAIRIDKPIDRELINVLNVLSI